jgi:hypothetical protein
MYRIPFIRLPGFSRFDNEGFEHLFPDSKSAREHYEIFKNQIIAGINCRKYTPVMRMCDGEFIYSVGRKKGFHQGFMGTLRILLSKFFIRQTTSWGENYTRAENRQLKKRFPELLRFISERGFIANHFLYNRNHFCEEYILPMQQWYSHHGIQLNSNNYTAFYFIYVLLNGPDSLLVFRNRNILIISSFGEKKREAVEKELKRRGVSDVYFQSISPTSSMLDNLILASYVGKIDLIMIAAGIGSANILRQCELLSVPAIDSGFCLECIANPSLRSERIFCLPDTEF